MVLKRQILLIMTDAERLVIPNLASMGSLAEALADHAQPGLVLLLQGDLGSGKTTLVQGLARGLGVVDPVTSPTFVLVQVYEEGRIPLIHADLYRLATGDVGDLELWDPSAISAIEWAERLTGDPWAEGWLQLTLGILEDDSREILAEWQGIPHQIWWQAAVAQSSQRISFL